MRVLSIGIANRTKCPLLIAFSPQELHFSADRPFNSIHIISTINDILLTVKFPEIHELHIQEEL